MSNYMVEVDVSAVSAYTAQTLPSVTIPFQPARIAIVNQSPVESVLVSFDGLTDHAKLTPGLPTQGLVFLNGATQIWLKRSAVGATTVQIIAED